MDRIPWSESDIEFALSLGRDTEEREANIEQYTSDWMNERMERIRGRDTAAFLWLAARIGMKPHRFLFAVAGFRGGSFGYTTHFVTKRDGKGKRKITAPHKVLKEVQRNISRELLSDLNRSPHSFGFLGGSCVEALAPHAKNTYLLMVDVTNAFPSIERDVIFRWFRKRDYSWRVSNILADLATFEGRLTQGSPLSPRIFELMFEWIDERLSRLAESVGGTYTRYADNVFFSVPGDHMDRKLVWTVLKKIWRMDLFHNVPRSEWYHPMFETHKLRVRTLPRYAVHSLGLVLRDGDVHNTRDFKRTLRKRIHHVRYLLGNGFDDKAVKSAWTALCGTYSHARRETLPPKLIKEVEELRGRIHQL
ncbi:MAG TPA: reverse transcriptase family protein [Candidatus Fimivivens sp.]|nr:reverse transcriptase family protein [Candidatus Fimivivens sp.]